MSFACYQFTYMSWVDDFLLAPITSQVFADKLTFCSKYLKSVGVAVEYESA